MNDDHGDLQIKLYNATYILCLPLGTKRIFRAGVTINENGAAACAGRRLDFIGDGLDQPRFALIIAYSIGSDSSRFVRLA